MPTTGLHSTQPSASAQRPTARQCGLPPACCWVRGPARFRLHRAMQSHPPPAPRSLQAVAPVMPWCRVRGIHCPREGVHDARAETSRPVSTISPAFPVAADMEMTSTHLGRVARISPVAQPFGRPPARTWFNPSSRATFEHVVDRRLGQPCSMPPARPWSTHPRTAPSPGRCGESSSVGPAAWRAGPVSLAV